MGCQKWCYIGRKKIHHTHIIIQMEKKCKINRIMTEYNNRHNKESECERLYFQGSNGNYSFGSTSISAEGDNIVTYEWDFGDRTIRTT